MLSYLIYFGVTLLQRNKTAPWYRKTQKEKQGKLWRKGKKEGNT